MASTQLQASAPRSFRFRITPGVLLWTPVVLMMLYVAQHNERFLVDANDPAWPRYRELGWVFYVHAIFAAVALLVGPFQFSQTLRRKRRQWHRRAGYAYIVGVMVGAPMGVVTEMAQPSPEGWNLLATVDAVLWMTCTGLALVFALKRDWDHHKKWMIRSYAVALIFIYGRFFAGITGLDQGTYMIHIIWAAMPLALLSGDLVVAWQEVQEKKATLKAKAAQS